MDIKNNIDIMARVLMDPANSRFTSKQKVAAWITTALAMIASAGTLQIASAIWRHVRGKNEKNETHILINQKIQKIFHKNITPQKKPDGSSGATPGKTEQPQKKLDQVEQPSGKSADQVEQPKDNIPKNGKPVTSGTGPELDRELLLEKLGPQHEFHGYALPKISSKSKDAPQGHFRALAKKMNLTENVQVPGIGSIKHRYLWQTSPTLDASVPAHIKKPTVRLPAHLSFEKFDQMRKVAQAGAAEKGVDATTARDLVGNLKGVVVEATLPYNAKGLLQDDGDNVEIHCIFQTGINLNGYTGGGIPLPPSVSDPAERESDVKKLIIEYSTENAKAALSAAVANASNVLVFNIGMGTGFFAGSRGNAVLDANIVGFCNAVKEARAKGNKIDVIVPELSSMTDEHRKLLMDTDVMVLRADKGAVAVLCARQGCIVSESVAGDPMSMLGIHGPGFWWESAGSASDEERMAFLTTDCYSIAHIPIDVQAEGQPSKKIAALSQYMLVPNAASQPVKQKPPAASEPPIGKAPPPVVPTSPIPNAASQPAKPKPPAPSESAPAKGVVPPAPLKTAATPPIVAKAKLDKSGLTEGQIRHICSLVQKQPVGQSMINIGGKSYSFARGPEANQFQIFVKTEKLANVTQVKVPDSSIILSIDEDIISDLLKNIR